MRISDPVYVADGAPRILTSWRTSSFLDVKTQLLKTFLFTCSLALRVDVLELGALRRENHVHLIYIITLLLFLKGPSHP